MLLEDGVPARDPFSPRLEGDSVYARHCALIPCVGYLMHAFRIPGEVYHIT